MCLCCRRGVVLAQWDVCLIAHVEFLFSLGSDRAAAPSHRNSLVNNTMPLTRVNKYRDAADVFARMCIKQDV